jgi:hypothetical protein
MYNNVITTATIRPVKPMPFQPNELFQVLRDKKFSLMSISDRNWWYLSVADSADYPFREIRKATQHNPIQFAVDLKKGTNLEADRVLLDELNAGGKVSFLDNDEREAFMAEDYCDLVYMEVSASITCSMLLESTTTTESALFDA